MSKKRIVSILLTICVAVVACPFFTLPVEAGSTPYTNINKISSSDFDTVATGTYTAIKVNGKWCYKFTKGSKVVKVYVSAFKNNLYSTNATSQSNTLTNYLNKFQNSGWVGYVHKDGSVSSEVFYDKNKKPVYKDIYSRRLTKYNIKETRANTYVRLRCELVGGVSFRYHQCIKDKNLLPKTPSTAAEYKKALDRTLNDYYTTPVWKLSISKPGNNKTYLNEYTMVGNGYGDNSIDAAKWINIAYSAVKCGKNAAKKDYKALLKDIVGVIQSFEKKASKYSTGGHEDLSIKNKWCYESTFTSPIQMKNKGNYLETTIYLGEPVSKRMSKL